MKEAGRDVIVVVLIVVGVILVFWLIGELSGVR